MNVNSRWANVAVKGIVPRTQVSELKCRCLQMVNNGSTRLIPGDRWPPQSTMMGTHHYPLADYPRPKYIIYLTIVNYIRHNTSIKIYQTMNVLPKSWSEKSGVVYTPNDDWDWSFSVIPGDSSQHASHRKRVAEFGGTHIFGKDSGADSLSQQIKFYF